MVTRRIDPRDLVLAIVAFNENKRVEGRTLLQKLAYFLNEKLALGMEFEPYYYGPYSESIAKATNTLVALGFLNEKEEHFPASPTNIFEPRRFTYELTSAGETILAELRRGDPTLFDSINKVMEDIITTEKCDYECLSRAAKMFHILKSQGRAMKPSQLSNAARDLGWGLTQDEINIVADFLKELGLIKELP